VFFLISRVVELCFGYGLIMTCGLAVTWLIR